MRQTRTLFACPAAAVEALTGMRSLAPVLVRLGRGNHGAACQRRGTFIITRWFISPIFSCVASFSNRLCEDLEEVANLNFRTKKTFHAARDLDGGVVALRQP